MTGTALVLDFGGVVSRTLFETHEENERALGVVPGSLSWRGPFDPDSDPLWQQMDRDEISERDYWRQRAHEVGALVGESGWSMSDMVRALRGNRPKSAIRPEAEAAIAHARKAGHKLAILSNELDLFYGHGFASELPLLKPFDAIVDATYTGVLKPDPEAYAACCKALDLPPSRCVFVDDQYRNVAGSILAGMHGVHFDVKQPAAGFDTALDQLKTLQAQNHAR